jgi:hypothetical protein
VQPLLPQPTPLKVHVHLIQVVKVKKIVVLCFFHQTIKVEQGRQHKEKQGSIRFQLECRL